jgi:transposase
MKGELPTIRRVPDDLWAEIEPLLGEEKLPGTRGRPPVSFRKVLDGILYVLRTGCQWKALPREYGSGSTCHRRFQQWVGAGVFERIWAKLLRRYDDVQGIGWRWQSLDSSSVKAPLGGRRPDQTPLIEASSGRRDTY